MDYKTMSLENICQYYNKRLEEGALVKDIESEMNSQNRCCHKKLVRAGYIKEGTKYVKAEEYLNTTDPVDTSSSKKASTIKIDYVDNNIRVIKIGVVQQMNFKVDVDTLREFKRFCDKNSQYTQQALISTALAEFVAKYTK